MTRHSILSALLLAVVMSVPAHAGPVRFAAELAAIADRDRANPVADGGVLFLGSSSIRLWKLSTGFPDARTINHGFGGATVTDVLAHYDLLVGQLRPESIVVYVGENDLAQGRPARDVARDVGTLLRRLRADFPAARIAYLSIKVAPARLAHRRAIAQANALIGAQAGDTHFDFIDAADELRLPDEAPDTSYFGRDGLHLSESGYARWNRIVRSYLARRDRPARDAGSGAAVAAVSAHKR